MPEGGEEPELKPGSHTVAVGTEGEMDEICQLSEGNKFGEKLLKTVNGVSIQEVVSFRSMSPGEVGINPYTLVDQRDDHAMAADPSPAGPVYIRDQSEECALSCAVMAQQCHSLPPPDREGEAIECTHRDVPLTAAAQKPPGEATHQSRFDGSARHALHGNIEGNILKLYEGIRSQNRVRSRGLEWEETFQ